MSHDNEEARYISRIVTTTFRIAKERRPNYQNDRIWALNIKDIPAELKLRHPLRVILHWSLPASNSNKVDVSDKRKRLVMG